MRNLHAVDMNLLVALDALLTTRSVTRAAGLAGLSPSAMSRVLGRLRDLFEDELLVRVGHELLPTARAQQVQPRLRVLLRDTEQLLSPPATSASEFEGRLTVLLTEHLAKLVLPSLLVCVREEAPRLALDVRHPGPYPESALQQGDAVLWVDVTYEPDPSLQAVALFAEPYLSVVRCEHPLVGTPVGLDDWVAYPHVSVSVRGWGRSDVDIMLERAGRTRHVALTVHAFALVADVVVCGDYVSTMPARLAQRLVDERHTVLTPPIELPPLSIYACWHRRSDTDPRAAWIRQKVLELFAGT
ncbi:LysR family transcriptional regulator [Haliangium ochraceum]|nr:LysR family transcriptional regulator [Haliangium ochraceum]